MTNSSTSIISILSAIQQQTAPYIYSIEFGLGIINCSLSILLFSRRQFRIMTYYIYFLAASVAMLFNLGFGLGTNLYMITYGNLTLTSVVFCKLRYYLLQCSAMMYRWYLVAASLDRYALSSNSVRLRNFVEMYIARRVVAINAILWLVLPIHNLIFYDIKDGVCGSLYSIGTQYYHGMFTLLAGCVLPASIMIISAFLTHRNLVLKRKRRQMIVIRQKEVNSDMEDMRRKRDRQVLIILISQVIIFVITAMPLMIYFLYIAATVSIPKKSNARLAIERFYSFMIEPILYLFPILSFYLYIMTSGMFRMELLIMLRAVMRYRWFNNMNRVQPIKNDAKNLVKSTAPQSLIELEKY